MITLSSLLTNSFARAAPTPASQFCKLEMEKHAFLTNHGIKKVALCPPSLGSNSSMECDSCLQESCAIMKADVPFFAGSKSKSMLLRNVYNSCMHCFSKSLPFVLPVMTTLRALTFISLLPRWKCFLYLLLADNLGGLHVWVCPTFLWVCNILALILAESALFGFILFLIISPDPQISGEYAILHDPLFSGRICHLSKAFWCLQKPGLIILNRESQSWVL